MCEAPVNIDHSPIKEWFFGSHSFKAATMPFFVMVPFVLDKHRNAALHALHLGDLKPMRLATLCT